MKDVWIELDLTKSQYGILKDAIDSIKEHLDLDYAYADVNCRLKVIFKDGSSKFFIDIDSLKSLIKNLSWIRKLFFF